MVLALGFAGRGVEDKVLPTELLVPGTEAHRWDDIREGHFGEDAAVLLRGPAAAIDRQGPALARDLALRPGTRALSPWSAGRESQQLRPSPEQALITLDLEVPEGETTSSIVAPLERFIDERVSPPVEPHLAGESPLARDMNDAMSEGAHRAELIAAPILVLVLLLVFRSPIAAAVPLVMGQGTAFASFGVISLILERADLDAISLSLASGIGLALGVDYSLLIITRFREGLDDGLATKQAASLAANTAGRTALFAGSLLIGIMTVSFFLSPGTVLLSSAVGAIVSTALSMLGAALVTPAAVTLLGPNVNKWQFGRRDRKSLLSGVVGRTTRRPAIAAAIVLGILMLVASPVAAVEMIPPDPRQLPEGSAGLDDYRQIRAAGFGPAVEVVLRAPKGAVMDPARLQQIRPFEEELRKVRYVNSVFGPDTLAERTKALRNAPNSIKRARRQLDRGERDLTRLARGLNEATGGVALVRKGLLAASSGARQLEAGSGLAADGSGQLAEGSRQAEAGAGQLTAGAREAGQGSAQLADGTRELSDGLNDELVPGADQLATELGAAPARFGQLTQPAQQAEAQARAAFDTLNRMTVGKTDPLFAQALQQAAGAIGATTGQNPLTGQSPFPNYLGLSASLAQGVNEAGQAARGARRLANGAREAAAGSRRLADGAGDLRDGLARLAGGNAQLQQGLGGLSAGSSELREGLAQLGAGQGALASGLEAGHRDSAPLEGGLEEASTEVGATRDRLVGRSGPFRPLRTLSTLERQSPGFFGSGYVSVAAFDGARTLDRDASTFLLDSDRGGGGVARISILPDVETNDPRTKRVVEDVTQIARDFEDDSGLDAAVGGTAGKLVDYDRVTSGRLPLLVLMICFVTYLMLVIVLRSLFLPAIAVVLNLLTVAAAFGVLKLLFVGGDPPLGGAGALDVLSVASIFTITFALSIDYQVFLLTRMREEFVRTQSNAGAIEFGIAKTAKVVTGAAAIMVGVFTAFGLSDFVLLKQFGVGLVVAVVIDATLVRLVLLPATMRLFGLTTWWLPGWIDERLPVLDVEGSEYAHETALMPKPA